MMAVWHPCSGSLMPQIGGLLLPHVSKVYSLGDIELVPNLATIHEDTTVVDPWLHRYVPHTQFMGGSAFIPCL